MVFASSLNPISADDWRFTAPAHRAIVTGFRHSFAVMRRLPCDVLLTPHPEQSGGDVKYARLAERRTPNPYIDHGVCRAYADKYAGLLAARLAKEAE